MPDIEPKPLSVPPQNAPFTDAPVSEDAGSPNGRLFRGSPKSKIFNILWWKFFNGIDVAIKAIWAVITDLQEGQKFIKYSISITGGQWSINGRIVAATAALTQPLYLSDVAGLFGYSHWILKTKTVFSGGGLTAASCTIGSATGGDSFFSPAFYDMRATVDDLNFFDLVGPALATFADDSVGIVVHGDVNWNTAGIVGAIDVWLLFEELQ